MMRPSGENGKKCRTLPELTIPSGTTEPDYRTLPVGQHTVLPIYGLIVLSALEEEQSGLEGFGRCDCL